MNAIAWAMVWVAIFYAPEVYRVAHGADPSDGAMAFAAILWMFVTAMLIWQTVR